MSQSRTVQDILRFFEFDHLSPELQAVSEPLGKLAHEYARRLPPSGELEYGLRCLLSAKDAFVRAALTK